MRDVDVHEVYQHRLLYPLHHDDTTDQAGALSAVAE
jgi:hypothetical protein